MCWSDPYIRFRILMHLISIGNESMQGPISYRRKHEPGFLAVRHGLIHCWMQMPVDIELC